MRCKSERKLAIGAILACFLFTASRAFAGAETYVCQIYGFNAPSTDEGGAYIGKMAMDAVLVIDRKTGRVSHPTLGNTYMDVTLLDYGTSDWGFKLISESKKNGGAPSGGRHVLYIEVKEFEGSREKPLAIISEGVVYWGACK